MWVATGRALLLSPARSRTNDSLHTPRYQITSAWAAATFAKSMTKTSSGRIEPSEPGDAADVPEGQRGRPSISVDVPSRSPPRRPSALWQQLSGRRQTPPHKDQELSSAQRRKKMLAASFGKNFTSAARNTEANDLSESTMKRFQRVMDNDPTLRQPRSFVEFYKVVTSGRRDAHAFIDTKVDPLGFSETVTRLRARIRRSNYMLLVPGSKWMQYWDMYMLFLLFYTATLTPYEVCMMWEPTSINALYGLNLFVNISFMVDLIFNFFLPYREITKQGSTRIVKDHKSIASHYLRSHFFIDLISVLPIDSILLAVDFETDSELAKVGGVATPDTSLEALRMVRMFRLIRLIKLFRILRASRIFARWDAAITVAYSDRELIRWMVIVLVLLHWLACALGLVAQLAPSQRTPLLQKQVVERINEGLSDVDFGYGEYAYGVKQDTCYGCVLNDPVMSRYCDNACLTPCEIDLLARQVLPANAFNAEVKHMRAMVFKAETWICRYNLQGTVQLPDQHAHVWLSAVHVAMIMLSGGVGSIYPENGPEYIIFTVGILIGSVIWAMVVGTICAMATTGDPHTIEYRQHMDSLNSFLAEARVPPEICFQARTYLRSTRELRKKLSYDELISTLSPGLRGEIMLYLSKSTFSHVWYLSSIEGECLVQLAARLTRHGFPPRERMASVELNILMRGIAARGGDLLYSGMCWGSDMILTSAVLRDTRPITALTYVEVQALSRNDLYTVLDMFPESAKMVQNAAVRMALKRTVILLKAHADTQKETKAPEGLREGSSKAYQMLITAFEQKESSNDSGLDLGAIFRIITGSRLRDLDDEGNLVEQVDMSSHQHKFALTEAEEKRALRRNVETLSSDVVSLKSTVSRIRDGSC